MTRGVVILTLVIFLSSCAEVLPGTPNDDAPCTRIVNIGEVQGVVFAHDCRLNHGTEWESRLTEYLNIGEWLVQEVDDLQLKAFERTFRRFWTDSLEGRIGYCCAEDLARQYVGLVRGDDVILYVLFFTPQIDGVFDWRKDPWVPDGDITDWIAKYDIKNDSILHFESEHYQEPLWSRLGSKRSFDG